MPRSSKSQSRAQPKSDLERAALRKGFQRVCGVDEAGRGPLAGPVVAAACIFHKQPRLPGINDSKLLSPKKRAELYQKLTEHPQVSFAVGIVSHSEIDLLNIFQATKKAMRLACAQLQPDYLLVDGLLLEGEIPCEKVIRGDQRSIIIAAASIIAKETRDRLMLDYHEQYPQYGFDAHKGYPTNRHREAIRKYGLTPIHRLSFTQI